jgi:type II secretory pathway pseudopilin PulG
MRFQRKITSETHSASPVKKPWVRRGRPEQGLGFTLTELIMALVILLILIPTVIPIYDAFISDSKEESMIQRLGQVRRAIVAFKLENGRYPYQIFDHFGNNVDFLDNNLSELTQGVHDGPDSYALGRRIYLNRIPEDPFSGKLDWQLIGVDNDGDGAFNEDPIEVTTSTHRMAGVQRALGEKTLSPLNFVAFDGDGDGLIDEDPIDVMDIRSRNPRYVDL